MTLRAESTQADKRKIFLEQQIAGIKVKTETSEMIWTVTPQTIKLSSLTEGKRACSPKSSLKLTIVWARPQPKDAKRGTLQSDKGIRYCYPKRFWTIHYTGPLKRACNVGSRVFQPIQNIHSWFSKNEKFKKPDRYNQRQTWIWKVPSHKVPQVWL